MDRGAGAAEAVKKLQPPVFWKYADSMGAQLRRWPATNIERALSRLFEAEAAVKRTGTPDTALTAQLLIQMAA
jgi:DNA polymerase-3 subunit delta